MNKRLCALFVFMAACHGFFGGRTTDEDQELNNFAEARQRAATYYDSGDYERAATQYRKALEYRPKHFPTRLGHAYSLMYTKEPTNLLRAQEEFEAIGTRSDEKEEVKRIYGLAVTHRTLAATYHRQAMHHDQRGSIKWLERDRQNARTNARKGIELFQEVIDIDAALAQTEKIAPNRVSASLTPDAYAGMAHCEILLATRDQPEPLKRAIGHIEVFSRTVARAREFWEKRRERTLMVDPVREGEMGEMDSVVVRGQMRDLYAKRILATIDQEVMMRRALVEVYIQMQRFADVIDECDRIVGLDPNYHRAFWLRGQAYAGLEPPNYRAAIRDLEEYRSRQDLDRLTDDLVNITRWITSYKRALAEQEARG